MQGLLFVAYLLFCVLGACDFSLAFRGCWEDGWWAARICFYFVQPVRVPMPDRMRWRTVEGISTHASLVGCDDMLRNNHISTHATRNGAAGILSRQKNPMNFNSRNPCGLRRLCCPRSPVAYFNLRNLCGLRLRLAGCSLAQTTFQLTQPVWVATAVYHHIPPRRKFQLTQPMRVATA